MSLPNPCCLTRVSLLSEAFSVRGNRFTCDLCGTIWEFGGVTWGVVAPTVPYPEHGYPPGSVVDTVASALDDDSWWEGTPTIHVTRAAHVAVQALREERSQRYEPLEPIPSHWLDARPTLVGIIRHAHEIGLNPDTGERYPDGSYQRWSYLVEGDPIRWSAWVRLRRITTRRFVSDWEDVPGA